MNAPFSPNAFLPGTRLDRAPTALDSRSFFDSIRTLVLRQSYSTNQEAIRLIETRDASNLAYGAEQSAETVRAKSGLHLKMQEVVRHMQQGRKIDAIKVYRDATGAGLKESKDFVESMQGMPGMVVQPAWSPSPSKDYVVLSKSHGYSDALEDEGRYSDQATAEATAKRVAERSPTSETLLVKIIGRTKSVFSMG